MKASSVSAALKSLVAARQPAFIWGGPGIGKSAVIAQLAKNMQRPLRDIRALLLDPVDLRGFRFSPLMGAPSGQPRNFFRKTAEESCFSMN